MNRRGLRGRGRIQSDGEGRGTSIDRLRRRRPWYLGWRRTWDGETRWRRGWPDFINPRQPNGRSGRRTNNWLCRTSISYSAVISLSSPKNNIRFLVFSFSFFSFALSLSSPRLYFPNISFGPAHWRSNIPLTSTETAVGRTAPAVTERVTLVSSHLIRSLPV